ncbi:hypothetical protein CMU19_04290 [Elizabethkingia anophelis]|nr:hypothetical protein [Elizabethkingia anophelis]
MIIGFNNKDMNNTQLLKVKDLLEERGRVTRNECLKMGISRLSSIIHKLRGAGMIISASRLSKSKNNYDYIYKLHEIQ